MSKTEPSGGIKMYQDMHVMKKEMIMEINKYHFLVPFIYHMIYFLIKWIDR